MKKNFNVTKKLDQSSTNENSICSEALNFTVEKIKSFM